MLSTVLNDTWIILVLLRTGSDSSIPEGMFSDHIHIEMECVDSEEQTDITGLELCFENAPSFGEKNCDSICNKVDCSSSRYYYLKFLQLMKLFYSYLFILCEFCWNITPLNNNFVFCFINILSHKYIWEHWQLSGCLSLPLWTYLCHTVLKTNKTNIWQCRSLWKAKNTTGFIIWKKRKE